eukprot:gene10326-11430_t
MKSKQDSSGRADDAVVTPPTESLSKPSASASASGDGQQVVQPLTRQRPPRSSSSSSSSSSSVLDPAQTPLLSSSSSSSSATVAAPRPSKAKVKSNGKVCIFTMDSIPSYEENSKRGGAAGELIIRHSLEEAFASLGLSVTVLGSDAAFDNTPLRDYRIILLDPWTWAMKGWRPKRQLLGLEEKIYLLDFFGASRLKGHWPEISPKHFLTAFPTPWNTFLGYKIPQERLSLSWSPSVFSSAGGASGGVEKGSSSSERRRKVKQLQGVIWGKDPKHFAQSSSFIKILADHVPLVTTLSPSVSRGVLPVHANISFAGHLRPEAWLELLAGSRFLLGLGHPLLGPSALDAVSVGCLFINPVYSQPQLEAGYRSQHAYLSEKLPSHVCDYPAGNAAAALECVERAVRVDLSAVIPEDMREEIYLDRVKDIFHL